MPQDQPFPFSTVSDNFIAGRESRHAPRLSPGACLGWFLGEFLLNRHIPSSAVCFETAGALERAHPSLGRRVSLPRCVCC